MVLGIYRMAAIFMSKASNKEYSAPTIIVIPYIETQGPHSIGTWTLRGCCWDADRSALLEG